MLVAANVALLVASTGEERAQRFITPHYQIFFIFKLIVFSPSQCYLSLTGFETADEVPVLVV